LTERGGKVMPPYPAMLLHVAVGDAVRHTLVAERIHQPIEDGRRVVPPHRGDDAVPSQANPSIIDYARRAGHHADVPHEPSGSTQIQLCGTARR
jgi:hypothetical protein